jgi:hypothetical protein
MSSQPSHTKAEFCALEKISRAYYYKLRRAGDGPDEMDTGRISPEARERWHREREAAHKLKQQQAGKRV